MKKIKVKFIFMLAPLLAGNFLATACSHRIDEVGNDGKLRIVATTSIVGDVVSQIGGDLIELSILLPIGADPHSFDPTPQDVAKIADADLVFANGAGLEEFLDNLIESAAAQDRVTQVSEGVELLTFEGEADHADEDEHPKGDPHTWTDPNNVIVWAENITRKLSEANPENAAAYAASADQYLAELKALDAWIGAQVYQIPSEKRKLVTDHTQFSYFAAAYGFEQVGALIPGYSTLAEPTAQELVNIEDAIAALGVQAIFVGKSVNPALAERVAGDTGVHLVYVYTGSLSEPGGDADSYLAYMRYNVNAFVEALK